MSRCSTLFCVVVVLVTIKYATAACKAFEGDPWAPHVISPDFQRLYSFTPSQPNTDPYDGYYLDVATYNIQSGLSMRCNMNLDTQGLFLRPTHIFGLQEVDIDVDLHCNCAQPQLIANVSGHAVKFLCTIPYRTGLYGSALGTVYNILETRYIMYESWTTEMRGATAIRLTPPQLAGKTLWVINTHLQYDNETTRIGSATELMQFIIKLENEFPNSYFILLGDFYTVVGAPSYDIIANHFQNAWTVYNRGTNGGYTYPSDNPSARYDHIWYRVPTGATAVIHSLSIPSIEYSDHRPILVTFDFGLADPNAAPYYPSTGYSGSQPTTSSDTVTTGISSTQSTSTTGATDSPATSTSGTTDFSTTSAPGVTDSPTTSISGATTMFISVSGGIQPVPTTPQTPTSSGTTKRTCWVVLCVVFVGLLL